MSLLRACVLAMVFGACAPPEPDLRCCRFKTALPRGTSYSGVMSDGRTRVTVVIEANQHATIRYERDGRVIVQSYATPPPSP